MVTEKRSYIYKRYIYLWRLFLLVPFAIGTVGYLQLGYPWYKALYGSFCFYFVSVYSTESSVLLDIARWLAPFCLATGLLYSLSGMMGYLKKYGISLRKDATVIYCDDAELENAKILRAAVPRSIVEEFSAKNDGKLYPDVPNQVLMLGDDMKNLEFAYQQQAMLRNKNVFMKLQKVDSNLLDKSHIRYFNVYELIGSVFWKKYPLFRETGTNLEDVHVAIIGSTELAEKLLVGAILNNLFHTEQKITYHVFGDQKAFACMYPHFKTMNKDEVVVHEESWMERFEMLKGMSRIILADEDNLRNLGLLLYMCPDVTLYVYSQEIVDLPKYYRSNRIVGFGRNENVYTKDNIMGDSRYYMGKELHFRTLMAGKPVDESMVNILKEREWRKIDGFMQSSYRAIADAYDLYTDYLEYNDIEEHKMSEMTQLEHIRWCRFYFLHHWKYGVPENGALRDEKKYIHRSLVPYEELPQEDRDRERIRIEFLETTGW